MRIAVTGAGGRLGRELTLRGCIPVESSILDFDKLKAELERIAPDAVINAAAFTDVEAAESLPKEAIKVNTAGAGQVRIAFDGYMIHISTSYVFGGDAKVPYKEEDPVAPCGGYGWSKWGGEIGIAGVMRNKPTLIVRTVSLFGGPSGRSDFVTHVLNRLNDGLEFYVPDYLYSNPIYIPHFVTALMKAIEQREIGLLHLAGRDTVSRFQWATMIAAEWGFSPLVVRDSSATLDPAPFRPLYAALDIEKAKKAKLPLFHLKEGLRAFHENQAS